MKLLTAENGGRETIFMPYEEIVKSPYPLILQTILENYKDFYTPYLRLEEIESYDLRNLARLCIQRTDVNIFEYLAKTDFDFESSLIEYKNKYADIYTRSEILKIGLSFPLLMGQKFTEKVYFYSQAYDPRIHLDLQNTVGSMDKVSYVVGESMADVVSEIPETITSFILNDVAQVIELTATGKLKGTNVLLANYGYNYALNPEGELALKIDMETLSKLYEFNYGLFTPKDLSHEDFALE